VFALVLLERVLLRWNRLNAGHLVRDDVRGPKNQIQAIAEKTSFSWFYLTAGGVFSALTSSKSSTDATASLCGLLLVRYKKTIHSDCFQLNKTRSGTPSAPHAHGTVVADVGERDVIFV
jgi:hypothetical protein